MKIIETIDLSREDCHIEESVTLVEEFGMYSVIICRKDTRNILRPQMNASTPTTDFNLAKQIYKRCKRKI